MTDENQDNKDRHFKGQHSNEEIECFYRHHWIVLLVPILLSGVFMISLGFFLGFMKQTAFMQPDGIIYQTVFISALVFTHYYIHRFFVGVYNYFLDIVIITNYRIVDFNKTLFLHDSQEVVDIAKIQDVTKEQDGLMRNIFNYGRLAITLSSSSKLKVFHFVPNPDFHFRVINRKKREYIQQRRPERQNPNGLAGLSEGVTKQQEEDTVLAD